MTAYKVEVEVFGEEGVWTGNEKVFDNEAEAEAYGVDLAGRWTLVKNWRVVPAGEAS